MANRSETNQRDSDIERDRGMRRTVAILAPLLVLCVGYIVGSGFTGFFKLPSMLGTSLGLGLGAFGVFWLIPKLYVTNDAVAAFVTVDLFSKELVSYGPGFHFCFPWEARSGANNVSLEEAAETFTFTVQTKTGTLTGKGSFRLRPDIKRLPDFLAGVGSVAADLSDLISATNVKYLADYSVKEGLALLKSLNALLAEDFKHGQNQGDEASDFEKRFGVIIGDVTVSELLPSKEVQKAMDGASEREALDDIVARNLGYPTMKAVHEAVNKKELKSEQVAYATENALAMTDNLHGMKIDRQSFTLRLQSDPELADALKEIGPGIAAILGIVKNGKQK